MAKVLILMCLSVLAVVLLANFVHAIPPSYNNYEGNEEDEFSLDGPADEGRRDLSDILPGVNKRSCIRRGSWCDSRPNDCCGGACRCNLWGTNCQCQRPGLFQKWG